MKQKRVSFKVAKALKEAGYPQGDFDSGNCDVYPLEDHDINYNEYTRVGKLTTRYRCETWKITSKIPYVVVPTYVDVWFWLWAEKGIKLSIEPNEGEVECYTKDLGKLISNFGNNPEEAIIAAIEYLANNDLIK